LNHLKHSTKPSTLITWLCNQQVFLEADTLGIGKTKTVGYLTQIHLRLINRISTKEKLYENLNSTIIDPELAAKLDQSLQDQVTAMQDTGDDVTIHCPRFELFQTTIGIGNNPHIETDILGIKCQVGKAALLREFLIQSSTKIKQEGLGKFIPAGLANIIGIKTMKSIIQTNNQYLKSVTTIPINGILNNSLQAEIIIDDKIPENECTPIKVQDYLLSTEWCLGLEPTMNEGCYLLITTYQHLTAAREWPDENLEPLFAEYILNYNKFTPIKGYEYPKCGDKPQFSNQLGTYADKLCNQYPIDTTKVNKIQKQWNRSPLHRTKHSNAFNFHATKYPELPKPTKNQNKNATQNPITAHNTTAPITTMPTPTVSAKDLKNQILADIQNNLTKMISMEITIIRTELTNQLKTLSTNLWNDLNTQIADVLETMATLNKQFTEVMDCLPTNPPQMPAHKNLKGWAFSINAHTDYYQNIPPLGFLQPILYLRHQPQRWYL